MTTIAILGLGEAGRLYAKGLQDAGAEVRGYDPLRHPADPGIRRVEALADAVTGADVIVSLVGAGAAPQVAADALPHAARSSVYADLNTAAPGVKHAVARLADARGVPMADVAVLAPVPRAGHLTPLLASGDGAAAFADRLAPYGVPISLVEGGPGEAARRKLLRSVFMKGLAALVVESVGAARAGGAEEWLREQIAHELGPAGADLVDRLIEGTGAHAARREHEMRDALAELESYGQPTDMTRATLAWFERIVAGQDGRPEG